MKRLICFLSTFTFVASTSTNVISCGNEDISYHTYKTMLMQIKKF
ncbi:hypothetical protein SLITO_v1c07180 [Spiroplasma litorale]|uniref:Lipoprotein n=1 Tax=Spiroplasma litorale TaxID=216942 RepID=A0A0K1W2E7_9MOLU|nr:lipoprotein [Spiroplasma litorale]AKX34343.1 hypothetical protein SLITO_v1c07180 [Spiroplasma litorale]